MGPVKELITHTGEERWEVRLNFKGDEWTQARRLTEVGRVYPEVVYLVWTRRVGESWQRVTAYKDGSRVEGHERLSDEAEMRGSVGRWRYQEIFTRRGGELHSWANLLPGLRTTIEDIEARLPQRHDQVHPPIR